MLGAVTRDPTGHDLAPLGDEILQGMGLLVFDFQVRIRTESAELPPVKELLLRS